MTVLIKKCGRETLCGRSLIDTDNLVKKIKRVIEDENLEKFISDSRQKFKVAVAGCPNSCSEPQIKDFSVIGQLQPFVIEQKCNGCGACLNACSEGAIELRSKKARVVWDKCLNCGQCISGCGKNAIDSEAGYKVIVGGKLGRRPVLARTLLELVDEEQVEGALRACIKLHKRYAMPGQRFSHVVDRLGIERVKEEC